MYEKLIEMSQNDDYTTADLLDYIYQDKQIWVFLKKINFVGKYEEKQ